MEGGPGPCLGRAQIQRGSRPANRAPQACARGLGDSGIDLGTGRLPWWCQWYRACLPTPEIEETQFRSLGWEDPLEEGMATRSSILAWRIPRREEPDGRQSVGSPRVGHD